MNIKTKMYLKQNYNGTSVTLSLAGVFKKVTNKQFSLEMDSKDN